MSISIHCWQGDDVGGFEVGSAGLVGGIYLLRATIPEKLETAMSCQDLTKALSLIPVSTG